jgi:hypothetical protein
VVQVNRTVLFDELGENVECLLRFFVCCVCLHVNVLPVVCRFDVVSVGPINPSLNFILVSFSALLLIKGRGEGKKKKKKQKKKKKEKEKKKKKEEKENVNMSFCVFVSYFFSLFSFLYYYFSRYR